MTETIRTKSRRGQICGFTIAAALLLLLAGCSRPTDTPTAVSSPTPTTASQLESPAATMQPTFPVNSPVASTAATDLPTRTSTLPAPSPTTTSRPASASPTPPLPSETPAAFPTETPVPWPYIRNFAVSPDEARTLYAVIGDRAYRSDDGGIHWARLDTKGLNPQTRVFSVTLDYRNAGVLYITTSDGIFKNVNLSGWMFVHPLQATFLAVDLVEPSVLWAGVSWTTEYRAVILKSTDAGRTWGKADFGVQSYMGYSVTHIAIDPVDPNILYANLRYGGRFGWPNGWLYRGGRNGSWEHMRLGPTISGEFSEQSCMANGLAFDPGIRRLYVGCDAYYYNSNHLFILASENAHEADSSRVQWATASSFGTTQPLYALGAVRPLAVDAREPKSVYILLSGSDSSITQPYRILVSHDNAVTWQDLPVVADQWNMPE